METIWLGYVDARVPAREDGAVSYATCKLGGAPVSNFVEHTSLTLVTKMRCRNAQNLPPGFAISEHELTCGGCGGRLVHVVQVGALVREDASTSVRSLFTTQIHAPLAETELRTLHLFCCRTEACTRAGSGWCALRSARAPPAELAEAALPPPVAPLAVDVTPSPSAAFGNDFGSVDWDAEDTDPSAPASTGFDDIEALLAARDAKVSQPPPKSTGAKQKGPAAPRTPSSVPDSVAAGFKSFYLALDAEPTTDAVDARARALLAEYEAREGPLADLLSGARIATLEADTEESAGDADDGEDGNVAPSGRGALPKPAEDTEYEASVARHGDKVFHRFAKRIERSPEQILRYQLGGAPLLATGDPAHAVPAPIPPCPACNGPRLFEFQLVPALLSALQPQKAQSGGPAIPDFGTVLVYTCQSPSCVATGNDGELRPSAEFVWVQRDVDWAD